MSVCFCGHARDEHEATFLSPCAVAGCDCDAFDLDEEASQADD